MNELLELARGLGAGAAFLLLLALVGALREDWVPGVRYRALVKENTDLKEMVYRLTGAFEGIAEVAKK